MASSAGWAKAFEADLLAVDDEAFVGAFGHGQRDFGQAVGVAAARAGKMRVALPLGAMMSQFVMPGPLVHENPVHEADLHQTHERSVNCHLVETAWARAMGNLILAQRFAGFEQDFQYGHSARRAVQLCRSEHCASLHVRVRLCHDFSGVSVTFL